MFTVRHEDIDEQLGGDLGLRVKAHDAHRLECVATIPLAEPDKVRRYEVLLEIAVPEQLWRDHDPWKRLFVRSRLGSPRSWTHADCLRSEPTTNVAVKLRVLAAVHDLKASAARIRRELRQHRDEGRDLSMQVGLALAADMGNAMASAHAAFEVLERVPEGPLFDEGRLGIEYLSCEVLQLATRVEAELDGVTLLGQKSSPIRGAASPLRDGLEATVDVEHKRRHRLGLGVPKAHDNDSLSHFIVRSSLLKKHFQQALFLSAEVDIVERKLGNWVAVAVAVLASSWYFVWQIYYLNQAMAVGTTIISLGIAGGVAGLLYAVKDRIKELGRRQLSGWLKKVYADRAVHLFVRGPTGERGRRLGLGRETIDLRWEKLADPLGGALNGAYRVRHVIIRDRLSHRGGEDLAHNGITSMKHIFRFDLSELFAGVDDRKKSIVVRDKGTLKTVQARRQYRVPVRARMFVDGGKLPLLERNGELLFEGRKLRGLDDEGDEEIWAEAD